jgi:hypothetical protein
LARSVLLTKWQRKQNAAYICRFTHSIVPRV